jgi:prepilin-type N-terminal cleavage/methylation domain-containing protein
LSAKNKKAFSLVELMVVLGIVGVIAGFVLPWIRGMFSAEKQSRDELMALTEQRIDEGDLKNRLINSSVMRSSLVSCKKTHLLMKGESPSNRRFSKNGDSIDFISSKPVGIGTIVNGSLKLTQSIVTAPGALFFLRSITGDNEEIFVRVSTVSSAGGTTISFDYDLSSSVPAFTSCSIQNPTNAKSYISSLENKRFSVEVLQFVNLSLVTEDQSLALYYNFWPKLGSPSINSQSISNSKLYDSIQSLNVFETFDGSANSAYGNYFVKMEFQGIKTNTASDGAVGVGGPHTFTRSISGAYSATGLEIGNIKSGTTSVVKAPMVTCSVIYRKFTNVFKDPKTSNLANVYEVKVLFSDAASVNTSTSPLNGSMNIAASNSSDPEAVRCFRRNQYNPLTNSFNGDFSKGELALIAQGGASFSDPMFCFLKTATDVTGKLTYLALTASTATQYFPKCEPVRLNP